MGDNFDRLESGRFQQAADEVLGKLTVDVDKMLSGNAGRGFPLPDGDTLAAVLGATQDAKNKLVIANGKIYDERRSQIFETVQFEINFTVKVARLAMELYRDEIFNALALEQAQWDSTREMSRGDVSRMNADTERRQVAIIQNRAAAEQQVIVYRQQLVEAEAKTLTAETALVQAQLLTAEKKLEIIDSIYQVLAAEQMVLAAEQRRAASLSQVLAAERLVAQVKQEMVPYYQDKAVAEQELAAATIAEIPILKAIEELGYDRVALRNAEESYRHDERLADLNLLLAQEQFTRASDALELARTHNRRLLKEYSNQIQALVLSQRKDLEEEVVSFRLDSGLAREAININNDVALTNHQITDLNNELANILTNMQNRAIDQNNTVKAGATRTTSSQTTRTTGRISDSTRDIMRQIIVGTF